MESEMRAQSSLGVGMTTRSHQIADRRPGVEAAVDNLFERLDYLEGQCKRLEQKVMPYLRQNQPQPGSPEKHRETSDSGASVLRARIDAASERLQRNATHIDLLCDMLDS